MQRYAVVAIHMVGIWVTRLEENEVYISHNSPLNH